MSDHFSYLIDDDAGAFFQKVACEDAEAVLDVRPVVLQSEPMEKKASAMTHFEKIASRLEYDLGILKTAGSFGLNLGMSKRASAYLETILERVDLEPEEFTQVFDKVAATAIETDLTEAYRVITEQTSEDCHPWIEQEIAKIGFDMATEAELEKQAFLGALIRGGRTLAGGARSVGSHALRESGRRAAELSRGAARQAKRPFVATGKGIKEQAGRLGKWHGKRHERNVAKLTKMEQSPRHLRNLGREKGFRKAWAEGKQKSIISQKGKAYEGIAKQEQKAWTKAKKRMGMKEQTGLKPEDIKAPTTAPTPGAPQAGAPAAAQETKAIQTQRQTQEGLDAARKAAEPPKLKRKAGNPPGGGDTPVNPPEAPKGVIDKLKKGGWESLSTGEKIQAGAGAYLGGKMLFGEGPVL